MMNLRNLSLLALASGMLALSSCGDRNNDANPSTTGPKVTMISGAGYTSASGDGVGNTTAKVGFTVTKGTADLDMVYFWVNGTAQAGYPKLVTADSITTFLLSATTNEDRFKVKVVDKDRKADSVEVVITKSVNEYSSVMLYAPLANNTSETFLGLTNNTTYTLTSGASNSASVDLGYFWSTNANATLCAPDNFLTTAYDLSTWAVRNATELKVTTSDLAGLRSAASLQTAFTSGSDLNTPASLNNSGRANSRAVQLTAGNRRAVKTAGNKYAVVEVVNVTGQDGSDGRITLRYRVQK